MLKRVALSRDGVGFGDSYIEHHYGQYHEHDAWLGTSDIFDNISNILESIISNISNILESIKASSGNFFSGVKASSDKHLFD